LTAHPTHYTITPSIYGYLHLFKSTVSSVTAWVWCLERVYLPEGVIEGFYIEPVDYATTTLRVDY